MAREKNRPKYSARRMFAGEGAFYISFKIGTSHNWVKVKEIPTDLRKYLVKSASGEESAQFPSIHEAKTVADRLQQISDQKIAKANNESIRKFTDGFAKAKGAN